MTTLMEFKLVADTPTTGTGTAAINGTTAVVLTGGAALTELAAGYIVIIAGERQIVNVVSGNDNFTVTTAFAQTLSGQALKIIILKNVEDFTTPLDPPLDRFYEYGERHDLGNSLQRGAGRPSATWHWGFIEQDPIDELRDICPGASARVYIQTRKNDEDDYAIYYAAMLWPEKGEEDKPLGTRVPFEITFRDMVLIA